MNNMQSENIDALMAALAKAQGKIQPASKDKANPYFKSKYADLASVWEACRDELSKNGLAVIQTVTCKPEGAMVLVTTLGHSSGQWIRGEMPIIALKQDPQTIGSALTYYRRYCLSAIVGVAPNDDDDGEKAQAGYRQKMHESNISHGIPHAQKATEKKVSAEEAMNIQMMLDECDDKYRTSVFDHLKKLYNTQSLFDLPADTAARVKQGAQKNMEENHNRQRTESSKQETLVG